MGRILIADDEERILGVMVDVLENAGHDVTAVPDGETALEKMKKESFDVALIDVMMPRLSGYQVAEQASKLPIRPRIIIVTARNFETDKEVVAHTGVDAFLPKPFANRDLIAIVNKLLAKKPGS